MLYDVNDGTQSVGFCLKDEKWVLTFFWIRRTRSSSVAFVFFIKCERVVVYGQSRKCHLGEI